jgi:hypothetical protein
MTLSSAQDRARRPASMRRAGEIGAIGAKVNVS